MKITSTAFANNGNIPSKYTCDGANINPPLSFSEIPAAAKSLALISDDPDAPMGTWVHWTIWNIDPKTGSIAENSKPAGIEGTTSFGNTGYGGPCPPSGVHHYHFKLYALDTKLNLPISAKKTDLEKAMQKHILAQADLIGLYTRAK
ncbi:YbhB/YbcL family Raf kinase inhibitor-like protein [Candidatus Peregrinibacteria bacterium]|nr:YbhB/YbcL family Raf kinase inhibitor-like protein [Candidatus Peregrinibacteria bacterium]